jgi:hypothetical protein
MASILGWLPRYTFEVNPYAERRLRGSLLPRRFEFGCRSVPVQTAFLRRCA